MATGSVSNDDRGVNEDGKKSSSIRLAKQHHESRFLVHFFVVTARLRCEIAYFHVLWRRWAYDNDFLFLFLHFHTVFKNSSPQKNCQHLTNWTKWNKRDKVWSSATSLFKWRFRSCRRRCCYKVPNIKRFLAAKLPLFQASTNFEICHAATKIAKNWRNRRFCWHWKIQVLEGIEGGPIKSTISAIFPIFLKIAKNWRNRRIS